MNAQRSLLPIASLIVALTTPAFAQEPSARILRPRATEATTRTYANQIIVGPAYLLRINDNDVQRNIGLLNIAVQSAIALPGSSGRDSALQLGVFHYSRRDLDQTMFQVKYYPARTLGFQVGYQNGSDGSAAIPAYFLLNLSAERLDPSAKIRWDVQFGLGAVSRIGDDTPEGVRSIAPATFAQLSVQLTPEYSVGMSYYGTLATDKGGVHRLFIGIGRGF